MTTLAALEDRNRLALERREAFRRDLADGKALLADFQALKHQHPYIGFVECRACDIPFLMFHANDDVVVWEYFWLGHDAYEPELTRAWIDCASKAERILDIGAYTGLMSILAALANPDCEVHAIEPLDRTVERLRINLKANGVLERVKTHARAAAAEYGIEMIKYYRDENFLGTGSSIHDKGKVVHTRKMVEMVNVDHYLGSKYNFDLIKIDVEGYEASVLDGIARIIKRDRPNLIIEVWRENSDYIFDRLDQWSYRMKRFGSEESRVVNFFCEPQ